MKKYAIVSLIVGISSNIQASEKQNTVDTIQTRTEHSISDGNLSIPCNESSQKQLRISLTTLEIPRSPKIQERLDCFDHHYNSKHDQEFIKEITDPKNKNYTTYQELIKDCTLCLAAFKQFLQEKKSQN